ncbi:putative MFS family arabinose efflux permease [Acidovorax soli]|uniref:Putative MFS family arabinose efflux permease n=1 Tax=Acidovorax soli TaxID=592050 RepID=A0A7X0PC56_9BURK|nr:MFS transporter [Acidovorax soli]MBB6559203.1 putative MFS family arabinose efflux permease [Acidovorax soli]
MPRALVMLFACASGLSVANVYYAQPLLDALAADFAIRQAAVGGLITATQVGCALALVLLVPLGDRMDRRQLMRWQCAALVAALLGTALAASPGALLAGMLALGLLGTAMTQGLIAFAATAAAPQERGHVVGAAQGGVVIGLLLARVAAGLLADLLGWRGVYLASALAMLALAALLWRALPAAPAPAGRLSYQALVHSMFTLLRTDRVLQVRGTLALLMFAAFSTFWSAMVLPLREAPHALSHSAIGAFGLVGALGALAATRAGRWADRGLAQHATAAALLLLVLAWLPLWLLPHSLGWLVLGVVALDLGGQAIHVTNQALILRGDASTHGRLVGCYMLFYAVGSGLGAAASTAAYAAWGWDGVCVLGAGVSATAAAFWAATLPPVPRTREHA